MASRVILDQFEELATPLGAEGAERGEIRSRLLRPSPAAMSDDTRRFPLVIYLHGAGERGSDNQAQLKYLPEWMTLPPLRQKFETFLLAPQCPAGEWWIDVDYSGPQPRMTSKLGDRLAAVLATADEAIQRYPIDSDRQYLTGISMGGFATWDLAIRFPDRFAAIVPICGGGDPSRVASLVDVPLWCFHGARDDIVPPQYSREMVDALRVAGGNPIYTEFPNVRHDSWTPAYRESDCLPWMFQQRRRTKTR
jgi:predicted peptidase